MKINDFGRALARAKAKILGKAEPEAELPKEEVVTPPTPPEEIKEAPLEEIKEAVTPPTPPEERVPLVKRFGKKLALKEKWSSFAMGFGALGIEGLRKRPFLTFLPPSLLIAGFLGWFFYDPSIVPFLCSLVTIIGTVLLVIATVGFLNFWNAKKLAFSVFEGLIIGCLTWFFFAPSLPPLVFFISFLMVVVLLGALGTVAMPIVVRDLTKTTRVVTISLAVIFFITAGLLGFVFILAQPVL